MEILVSTHNDSKKIKDLINKMYGFEYEIRSYEEIEKSIYDKNETYVVARNEGEIIGFAGAKLNSDEYEKYTDEKCVIEYIYVLPSKRNLLVAYELMKKLIDELLKLGKTSAIMQVQTHNKQRFFHYALSNKNIIHCQKFGNTNFDDQILKIDNLERLSKLNFNKFLLMVKEQIENK